MMIDKPEDIAAGNPDDPEAAATVRAAWLGLIRLLAREAIRHLGQGTISPGEDAASNTPSPAGPDRPTQDHPS